MCRFVSACDWICFESKILPLLIRSGTNSLGRCNFACKTNSLLPFRKSKHRVHYLDNSWFTSYLMGDCARSPRTWSQNPGYPSLQRTLSITPHCQQSYCNIYEKDLLTFLNTEIFKHRWYYDLATSNSFFHWSRGKIIHSGHYFFCCALHFSCLPGTFQDVA